MESLLNPNELTLYRYISEGKRAAAGALTRKATNILYRRGA